MGLWNSKYGRYRPSAGIIKMEMEREIGRDEAQGQEGARPPNVLNAQPGAWSSPSLCSPTSLHSDQPTKTSLRHHMCSKPLSLTTTTLCSSSPAPGILLTLTNLSSLVSVCFFKKKKKHTHTHRNKTSWENQHLSLSLVMSRKRCVPHQWFLTMKSLRFHRWLSDLSRRLINGMIQTKMEEQAKVYTRKGVGWRGAFPVQHFSTKMTSWCIGGCLHLHT